MKHHSLTKQKEVQEGTPNRATYHHGSTVQGGSDYGQGSNDAGGPGNVQGSEGNKGSNYENEQRFNSEALRSEDLKQQQRHK